MFYKSGLVPRWLGHLRQTGSVCYVFFIVTEQPFLRGPMCHPAKSAPGHREGFFPVWWINDSLITQLLDWPCAGNSRRLLGEWRRSNRQPPRVQYFEVYVCGPCLSLLDTYIPLKKSPSCTIVWEFFDGSPVVQSLFSIINTLLLNWDASRAYFRAVSHCLR